MATRFGSDRAGTTLLENKAETGANKSRKDDKYVGELRI